MTQRILVWDQDYVSIMVGVMLCEYFYVIPAGYSEDSDYTSDLNYPVGQHANCSASQFRNAAHQMHTPQVPMFFIIKKKQVKCESDLRGESDVGTCKLQLNSNH